MKKMAKLAIIAIAAVIGFSFVSCDTGTDDGDIDVMGAILRLYNKSVTKEESAANRSVISDANRTDIDFGYYYEWGRGLNTLIPVSKAISGTAEVTMTNNKLTIKLDTPKPEAMDSLATTFFGNSLTVTPEDTKCWVAGNFYESTGEFAINLDNGVNAMAVLMYLDKNATLNGTHPIFDEDDNEVGDFIFDNVLLEQGWSYLIVTYGRDGEPYFLPFRGTKTLPADFDWRMYKM